MTSTRRRVAGAVAALAAAATASTAAAAGRTYTVTIQQMAFAPPPAKLKVGDAIEWVNNDIFVHSVTARDKSFDLELKPKAHARLALTRPGTIAFYCRFHPGMTGRLVVEK